MIQLTLDSLRYWVEEYHVDGFRFDLSVTLGREQNGFDPGAGFFDALLQDPTLSRVKLISEPWDLGPGGYQLGHQPPRMAEWNASFRDDVRKFWRGDSGLRGALAARLQGSADLFDHQRRRPWASVNYITAHDGFTLQDLVSYNQKHNEANGEDNQDGTNDNHSNNWGVEGPTEEPQVLERRERVKRAMLATLLFSHGTPMLLGGDEFGRSQHGNKREVVTVSPNAATMKCTLCSVSPVMKCALRERRSSLETISGQRAARAIPASPPLCMAVDRQRCCSVGKFPRYRYEQTSDG